MQTVLHLLLMQKPVQLLPGCSAVFGNNGGAVGVRGSQHMVVVISLGSHLLDGLFLSGDLSVQLVHLTGLPMQRVPLQDQGGISPLDQITHRLHIRFLNRQGRG